MRPPLLLALVLACAAPAQAELSDASSAAARDFFRLIRTLPIKGPGASTGPSSAPVAPKTPIATPAVVEPGLAQRLERHLFDEGVPSVLVVGGERKGARCLETKRKSGSAGSNFMACLEVELDLPECKVKPGQFSCAKPALMRWKTGDIVIVDEDWRPKPKSSEFLVGRWTYKLGQNDMLKTVVVLVFEARDGDAGPHDAEIMIGDPSDKTLQLLFKEAAKKALALRRLFEA